MQRLAHWILSVAPRPVRQLRERVTASPLGRRLAHGTFWMVAGTATSRLMGLATSILLARILGKIRFGELGTIQGTVGLFGALVGVGVSTTATKYVAEYREAQPERCGRIVGFLLSAAVVSGVVASLGLLCFGDWLAVHTLAAPQLAPMLRMGALLVIFGSLQGAYLGALAGFEAFREVCGVTWISSLAAVPLAVAGALWLGLAGAVWALVLQALLACILGHAAVLKRTASAGVRLSMRLPRHDWPMLWSFMLPAFLATLCSTPAAWFARTLLVNQAGGYAQAGLVSAANQWMNLVYFLPWTMGGVLVPIFANLYSSGQRAGFLKLLRHNILINACVAAAVATPLALLCQLILRLYGPAFSDGAAIFVCSMIAAVLTALNNLLSRTIQSTGRAWTDLACNGVWAVTVIAGSLWLVPRYRGLGVLEAQVVAAALQLLCQGVVIKGLFAGANPERTT